MLWRIRGTERALLLKTLDFSKMKIVKNLLLHLLFDVLDIYSIENLILLVLGTLPQTTWNKNALLFHIPIDTQPGSN
jgi:hypothetical protein